jgi:hypothetical protein
MSSQLPSWITNLSDPILNEAFTYLYEAYQSGDSVTEAELATVFGALTLEDLFSSSGTLSTDQLTDLQSIAANIGSIGASPYLQFITNAFVNGNPANATWTSGRATSTPLFSDSSSGYSLQVGATALQLAALVDKWFLGTDLPSDVAPLISIPPGAMTTPRPLLRRRLSPTSPAASLSTGRTDRKCPT